MTAVVVSAITAVETGFWRPPLPPRMAYRTATRRVTNAAPNREPVSIVKPSTSVIAFALTSVSEEAATGDPLRTNNAPSHPSPNVDPALRTRMPSFWRMLRFSAPVFITCRARTNRNSATTRRRAREAFATGLLGRGPGGPEGVGGSVTRGSAPAVARTSLGSIDRHSYNTPGPQWAPSAVVTARKVRHRIHRSSASDQFWM